MRKKNFIWMSLVLMLFFTGCAQKSEGFSEGLGPGNEINADIESVVGDETLLKPNEPSNQFNMLDEVGIEVHFIDVGQGDSILIKQGSSAMLVDAGENDKGELVVDYLKAQEINDLEYIIGTHPHSDHIGGLDDVVNEINVKKAILPNVTHTTKTFEDLVNAIVNRKVQALKAKQGDIYSLGEASFIIVSDHAQNYKNLNDHSVSIKLTYKNNSFVFTGDGEKAAESNIVNSNINLSADVFKAAHHGSSTSNSEALLKKVDPAYTVIQVGRKNNYGHPESSILERFARLGVKVYRNDLHGTVTIKGDGNTLNIYTEKSDGEFQDGDNQASRNSGTTINPRPSQEIDSPQSKSDNNENVQEEKLYVGNRNSKIFHKPSCSTLPSENNRVYFKTAEEAVLEGYRPCKKCTP